MPPDPTDRRERMPVAGDEPTTPSGQSVQASAPTTGKPLPDTEPLGSRLRTALRRIAGTNRLLVATDYDGTLAPIVSDPGQARPLPGIVTAMRRLAELPSTSVAVISGRSLRDLAALSGLSTSIQLVGSHGVEFEPCSVADLDPNLQKLLSQIQQVCAETVADVAGAVLEPKPAGVAVHVRNAQASAATEVLEQLSGTVSQWPGVTTIPGKKVVEFSVVKADKGLAIERLRDVHAVTATIFIGDDITDESAFARLRSGDIGIKVGPGDSRADYRIKDPAELLVCLEYLITERRSW